MLAIFLLILIYSIPSFSASSEVEGVLNDWKKIAAKYNGELTDLSDASKTAIVTGNLDFAIKPYLKAYESPLKDKLGLNSIYQIFLIYIDPVNKNRSLNDAKVHLKILEEEWGDAKATIKARQIYQRYSIKEKN